MIRCVAIDDEPKALEVIAIYADKVDQIELQATFTDPVEASLYLESHPVDLLFLDINMKGLNGFELLETLTHKPKIIFTTAYSEYAVESYRVDALDYLVKPIPFSQFLKAVNKLKADEVPVNAPLSATSEKIISIKSGTAIHRVQVSDILFVEADGNYCKYFTQSGMVMALGTLKEALTKLDPGFMQVHRSFIVARKYVEKVESHQLQVAGKSIPVSGSFRKSVLEAFS